MVSQEGPHRKNGGKDLHIPVLVEEILDALSPNSKGCYADLSLGAGGHARAILERTGPGGLLLGLDRDAEILTKTQQVLANYPNQVLIKHGNFSDAASIFADFIEKVDGVIMDLGLSSFQLDQSSRGFSIFRDGPLDFRMDVSQEYSARDLVKKGKPEELLYAIGQLGEEPRAKAIVKAIVEERKKRPLLHTSDIRNLVEKVYGRKSGKIHPATRTFQGLRMMVNNEISSLELGLPAAFDLLKPKGRLAVISFHSGEDRIVKDFFKKQAADFNAAVVTKKPIRPGNEEIRRNRRCRSSRLRVLEKAIDK